MEPVQIPSFRVQIMDYVKGEGYVTYSMKVYSVDDTSFHVEDRYRNMRNLWENIKDDAVHADRIPDFPPKKWFGSKSREFLEVRKTALQNFFNNLLDSPDKNIFKHVMKYFKRLAKNREAKDALIAIEEAASGKKDTNKQTKREDTKVELKPQARQTPNKHEEEKSIKPKREAYQDSKTAVTSKDYNEHCSKIVENFNKKLIDLGYTGADAIQDIMAKGQSYVKHFEESNINSDFNYETRLLDIPEGKDSNLALLESPDTEAEALNDETNDTLHQQLSEITEELNGKQYEKFLTMNEVIWRGA